MRRLLALSSCCLLVLTALVYVPASAQAVAQPFEQGPDPTAEALRNPGPFAVLTTTVSDQATPGFGAATIYYPADPSSESLGAVVALPGFTASRSSTAWIAERVASHGFVVLNADTNGIFDFPAARGTQMLAAVDYLRESSPVSNLVDPTRVGVMGHSMGGGGALEAIATDPSIAAAVPLTPWNGDKTWGEVTVPTLILGAENDAVAGVADHALPFYNSMFQNERAYAEVNNGTHSAPTGDESSIVSQYTVAWFKRYIDDDPRYVQFICPGPQPDSSVSRYESSCSSDIGDLPGDANCDGTVDQLDAQLILDFVTGLTSFVATCELSSPGVIAIEPANVAGSASVDAFDALVIAQCVAGAGSPIDC